jgi:hypothetical protein
LSSLVSLLVGWGHADRKTEPSRLIDLGQLAYDVIVEAVEADHEGAYARRKPKKPYLDEGIGLEITVLERTNSGLISLAVSVQRTEVEVRGVFNNIGVPIGGAKQI